MARALWKGTLSFGLVTIPIEIHTAVRDTGPNFKLLRDKDKSPIKYERVASRGGPPVGWEDVVKGFEYEKGRFVVLTKEDFEKAALEKSKTIDILDFVKTDEIDDRFFNRPYYLIPAKGGEKAYALLREAIRKTDRIGISKFILRDKQHLAAVEVIEDALVLTTMRFAEELVDMSSYKFPDAKHIRTKDLELATTLVENLAADWEPEKYANEYRENLMKIIQAKKKGRTVQLEEEEQPRSARVVDLMERLQASLQQTRGRSATKPRGKKKPTRHRAA